MTPATTPNMITPENAAPVVVTPVQPATQAVVSTVEQPFAPELKAVEHSVDPALGFVKPILSAAEVLDPAIKSNIMLLERGKLPSKLDLAHGAAAFGATLLASSGALGLISGFAPGKVLVTSGIVGAAVTLLRRLA